MEQKITRSQNFQTFQFQFRYQAMTKIVLIKTQKPQLCCYPDGLSVFHAVPNSMHRFESSLGQKQTFFYLKLMLGKGCQHAFCCSKTLANINRLEADNAHMNRKTIEHSIIFDTVTLY